MLPRILATRHLVYCMTARGRRRKRSYGTSVDNGQYKGLSDMSDTFVLPVCIGRRLKSLQETRKACQKWSCTQTQAHSWIEWVATETCCVKTEDEQHCVVSLQTWTGAMRLSHTYNAPTVHLYCQGNISSNRSALAKNNVHWKLIVESKRHLEQTWNCILPNSNMKGGVKLIKLQVQKCRFRFMFTVGKHSTTKAQPILMPMLLTSGLSGVERKEKELLMF